MKNDTSKQDHAVNLSNGKVSDISQDSQTLDEFFTEMNAEWKSNEEYPLQPIPPAQPVMRAEQPQSAQEAADGQPRHEAGETSAKAICEADTANMAGTPATDEHGVDFSKTDNPEQTPNIGLFTIKSANEWIDEASSRPMPCKLFGQLWYEHEVCILFSSSNLGKSILAVQIADAISSGKDALSGMAMEAQAQTVLYFDFELSDKQFELRYISDDGNHYQFSPNLKRVEINPDVVEYPDGCDFEEYIKVSLQQAVEESGAKVIIIDNITYLSRETEKAKNALPLMQWLQSFGRKYGLSILVLAHTPKRSTANPITMNDCFGSVMLQSFCNTMFAIGESSRGKEFRYIIELKQRNLPFAHNADNVIVCEIAKPDNFLKFRFIGYGYESEHLRKLTDNDREAMIEHVKELSAKGKSQREIAKELGISPSSVNNYLKK